MFKKLQRLMETEKDESRLWTEFYSELERHEYLDSDYLEHTRNANINEAMKEIDRLSFEECCTWLTWILRGERFSAGLFGKNISNGNVKALLNQAEETCWNSSKG